MWVSFLFCKLKKKKKMQIVKEIYIFDTWILRIDAAKFKIFVSDIYNYFLNKSLKKVLLAI